MKLNFWQILGLVLLVGGVVALMIFERKPATPPVDDQAASQPA